MLECFFVLFFFCEALKCFIKRQKISDNLQQRQQDKQDLTNRLNLLNNQKEIKGDCQKEKLSFKLSAMGYSTVNIITRIIS